MCVHITIYEYISYTYVYIHIYKYLDRYVHVQGPSAGGPTLVEGPLAGSMYERQRNHNMSLKEQYNNKVHTWRRCVSSQSVVLLLI